METIRLGLIGDNIAASRAPDLHHAAARICGIDVKYERLVPRDLMQNAVIVAAFVYDAANRDEKLPRKPAPTGAGRGGRVVP